MDRRQFLILLQATCATWAIPFPSFAQSPSECIVEIELKYPFPLTPEELDKHLAKIQKFDQVNQLFADFARSGRMKLVSESVTETAGNWTYSFASRADVDAWTEAIRKNKLVNKDYLGGAFVWTSRVNGKVVS